MASKGNNEELRLEKQRARKEAEFKVACKKMRPYLYVAAAVVVVALLLFFVTWCEVYNTDIPGPEVAFNGWSCVVASITRDFSSTSAVYGDMAVPFYYYAGSYCESLALVTLIAFIAVLASLAVQVVAAVKGQVKMSYAAAPVSAIAAILLIACFFVSRSMSGSQILPLYCNYNPACSIQSSAYIPAIAMLVATAVDVLTAVKYAKAGKLAK